jgi:opacity protein-like surface antigen
MARRSRFPRRNPGICDRPSPAIDSIRRTVMMKNVLFAAGAALVVATSAVGASAGQPAAPVGGGGAGAIIRIDDNRYYDDGYYGGGDSSWQYQYQDRGYNDDWRDADYGRRDAISPRWIVRNLERSNYRYISRPVLNGRFYQVKAVNPNGKKVKLYIDAYTGQLVKVKS